MTYTEGRAGAEFWNWVVAWGGLCPLTHPPLCSSWHREPGCPLSEPAGRLGSLPPPLPSVCLAVHLHLDVTLGNIWPETACLPRGQRKVRGWQVKLPAQSAGWLVSGLQGTGGVKAVAAWNWRGGSFNSLQEGISPPPHSVLESSPLLGTACHF